MLMNSKIIALAIAAGILSTFAATISTGPYTVYAKKHDTVRVDCKDLAITLISWDQLLAMTDTNERQDIEDNLGEDGVANGLFQDWINKYLNNLVDDAVDHCNHLKSDIEDYMDDMELKVP
jgi:hypothetical protein